MLSPFHSRLPLPLVRGGREDRPSTALNLVAEYDANQGRLSDAMEKAYEVLDLNRSLLGEDEESTWVSWNRTAHALNSDGRYKEAVEIYRRV